MEPSLTETMTSRNGMLLGECEQVNLMVECKLLRKSTNSFSFSGPAIGQIMKISSINVSHKYG